MLRVLTAIESKCGADSVTLGLRTLAHVMADDGSAAIKTAQGAVRIDAMAEQPRWNLLLAYATAERFGDAVQALRHSTANHGYVFNREDFSSRSEYAAFARSAEFKRFATEKRN
jgi:hypothetical protein